MPSVLVYGCNGALGSVIVDQLKNKNYHVIGIDFAESKIADVTILGDMKAETLSQQAETILSQAAKIIKDDQKLEAVISAAGGWAGGWAGAREGRQVTRRQPRGAALPAIAAGLKQCALGRTSQVGARAGGGGGAD